MREHMIEAASLWSLHHHSGFSHSIALQWATRLLDFLPLGPLTGEDSEWRDARDGCQQNTRCGHVFRDRRDDGSWHAYDSKAVVFEEPDGSRFQSRESRRDITFP